MRAVFHQVTDVKSASVCVCALRVHATGMPKYTKHSGMGERKRQRRSTKFNCEECFYPTNVDIMFLVAAQQAQTTSNIEGEREREHEKIYHIHSTVIKSN